MLVIPTVSPLVKNVVLIFVTPNRVSFQNRVPVAVATSTTKEDVSLHIFSVDFYFTRHFFMTFLHAYLNLASATGTYCGNGKCNPGEVCKMDKTSKRQQCGRP